MNAGEDGRNVRDPLDALRGDDPPVPPDPAFADRLRKRLESIAARSNRSVGVETSAAAEPTVPRPAPEPTVPRPAALPYLAVAGARAAIDWYVDALGATLLGEPILMDDGRVGHAELGLGDGVLYLADEFPEAGLKAPASQQVSVSLLLPVTDTPEAMRRARAAGAEVQREPYENHGSLTAVIVDPFGHRWMLSGPVTGPTIRHGDLGYASVWTPDAERAAAFYGHVLGWTVDLASHRVTNTVEHIGMVSMAGPPTLFCCYAVGDLARARQAIVDGGGTAGEPVDEPFGTVLDAVDPSGTAFAVYEPRPGDPRPALNGAGPGELSYLTYQVPDSAAFKAFYGQVLFWSFERGRIEDGWGVVGAHPMSGAAGGSDRPVAVPMWTVADVDEAVDRVREAGGTVIDEPSRQPYGRSALCTDDQGSRFYLGQH